MSKDAREIGFRKGKQMNFNPWINQGFIRKQSHYGWQDRHSNCLVQVVANVAEGVAQLGKVLAM